MDENIISLITNNTIPIIIICFKVLLFSSITQGKTSHPSFWSAWSESHIWDMLPATLQKATTKVKFKLLIKKICRTV